MKDYEALKAENARLQIGNVRLGPWMAAALDDPTVCDEMKDDIRTWFNAQSDMEGA